MEKSVLERVLEKALEDVVGNGWCVDCETQKV